MRNSFRLYSSNRPVSITDGLDTTRFVYLADGTKLSVLNTEGEGLVYRGAMVYRQTLDSDDEPVLTLESARCPEGRLTPSAPLLYVEDHLGSVRAVIDGSDGCVLESSNYSAYGTSSAHSSTVLPSGLTLRERYTGCEDLDPDFLLPYTDHQARLYSSTLSRWMVPDPLSEKYYGISPYAYCGGNPMNFIDPYGTTTYYANGKSRTIDDGHDEIVQVSSAELFILNNAYDSNVDLYLRFRDIFMGKNGYMNSSGEMVLPAALCLSEGVSYTDWLFSIDSFGSASSSVESLGIEELGNAMYNKRSQTWIGKNGKQYNMSFNGNRYTGGKLSYAQKAKKILKYSSKGITSLQLIPHGICYARATNPGDKADALVNCVIDAVSLIPYVGGAVSLAWSFYGEYYFSQNIVPLINFYVQEEE